MACINTKFVVTEEIVSAINMLCPLASLKSLSTHELNNLTLIRANPKTILLLTKYHYANADYTFEFIAQAYRCINDARRAPSSMRLSVLDKKQKWSPGDETGERTRSIEKKLSLVGKWRCVLKEVGDAVRITAVVSSVVLAAFGIHMPLTPSLVQAIDLVEPWLDTKLQRWEEKLNGERDLVRSAEKAWFGITSQLDTIRVLWERAMFALEMVWKDVEAGNSTVGMDEQLSMVEERINELEEQVEMCITMMKATVTEFFNKLMND